MDPSACCIRPRETRRRRGTPFGSRPRAWAAAALLALSPVAADAQFGPSRAQMAREAQIRADALKKAAADRGLVRAYARPPAEALRQMRLLHAALGAIRPERPGTVDAYVLAVGLDSDPVFGREAAESARVLARRYGAEGRTLTLAVGPGAADPTVPDGSPDHLAAALAHLASVMNRDEDVLVLFLTAHGDPISGLAYRDGERARGDVAPARLAAMLNETGIKNRFVIVSACYSGVFVPALDSDTTLIMTAASHRRPSFGCRAENDWTFFGDALVNTALRKPKSAPDAFAEAGALIATWESRERLDASEPQIRIGARVPAGWLAKLDARVPVTPVTPRGAPAAGPAPAASAGAASKPR